MDISEKTYKVKQLAKACGFDFCGIARAEKLDEEARRLEKWLSQGMHASMQYMERYFDLRRDPTLLVPGAKSVVTLLKNYYPSATQQHEAPKISKYAYGKDYHEIIRGDLTIFLEQIRLFAGDVQGRGFVDSAPVLERAWANKSGLGWIGKNAMMINKSAGSFYFIATLIIDLELEYDTPLAKDFCGTCTKCIDACPTEAILPGKVVDARKCISYFTIELKDLAIPPSYKNKFDNWLFGCDICNDVCPWNKFSSPHQEESFSPMVEIIDFTKKDWEALTEDAFRKIFKHSPLKRSKFAGIMRNLKFLRD
ncbi:tRNA epoxyqueuosine(34) reductase QueG [Haoranjiania flava]|uniref:Epoxyqueuosine reductase n=1 Tax=Haoranjiania flava TaxID=1856322 RepID=A0AAE3LND8_9BACT|nr:tRNA epoxyqueuosine(34) reductase QueG [Haoranjiania flava]MCU7694901.1 tRNA epoxyqueuosine(34) reductase QueG [Haoranjiania flava]